MAEVNVKIKCFFFLFVCFGFHFEIVNIIVRFTYLLTKTQYNTRNERKNNDIYQNNLKLHEKDM